MNNTVIKTLDILNLLSVHTEALSLSQISRLLDIPKSTAFDILHTLESRNFVTMSDSRLHLYRLGAETFRIGYAYLQETGLDSIARPILSELRTATDETVFLASYTGGQSMTYTMKFLSSSEYQAVFNTGDSRPLLSFALGKAVLSAYEDERVFRIMNGYDYRQCSVSTITDFESLIAFLRAARQRGYVVDSTQENIQLASPVAAPLLDAGNHVIGAISIVVMNNPDSPARVREMGELVSRTALDISRGLGYQGKSLFARSFIH